jgi:hypothetical protein
MNECQEYLLGIKAAGALGWQPYHLHVSIVYEFWEPQPTGALRVVQAFNGIALPFTHHRRMDYKNHWEPNYVSYNILLRIFRNKDTFSRLRSC